MKVETLSDENKTLIEEKRSFQDKLSISSQKLNTLQNKCCDQRKYLCLLKGELEELKKSRTMEKNSFAFERDTLANKLIISNTKRNQLKEEYSQLKNLNSKLAKDNEFLLSKDRKLQSRLQGFVGDGFDKAMDKMKNCFLSIAQHLSSQKQGSHHNLTAFDISQILFSSQY